MLAHGKPSGACPSRWRRSLRPATAVPGILRRSCVSLVAPFSRSRRLRAQHDLERLLGRTQQEIESPGVLAQREAMGNHGPHVDFALIHISEPTRLGMISYAVFCLKKKKKT